MPSRISSTGRGRGRGRGSGGRNDHPSNPKKHAGDNPRHANNKRPKRDKEKSQNDGNRNGANATQKPGRPQEDTHMEETKSSHVTNHKFSDLKISAESRRAMAEVFCYEFMTAVQHETLPLILKDNKDCLAKAKTGTGKTLAFMIPTIERIVLSTSNKSRERSDICCLVISPTRELAQQIGTETEKLLTFHKSYLRKVVVCVGGTNKKKDDRALAGTTPIVVATPGRLLDHLQNGIAERMTNLDTLIFDEGKNVLKISW